MRIAIEGGYFDDAVHAYYGNDGLFVPSATQILKLNGLSNYDGADEADMENAARRGTEVHALAAALNRHGEVDPNWISDECSPYFFAYTNFLSDTGFKPDPAWIETPIIACIRGMRLGITADVFGKLRNQKAIIELKCTSGVQASWAVQTSLQELSVLGSNHVGQVRRFALQLMKSGRYKLHEHTNHHEDETTAIAALWMVWWRLNNKEKIWEKI